jgi:hypothetical protein
MPTTPAVEKPNEIYQMKVTLLGTDPPIWRRLLVPAELTLEQLHHVLQRREGGSWWVLSLLWDEAMPGHPLDMHQLFATEVPCGEGA